MANPKTVRYVDFGLRTAREFWDLVAVPSYKRFLMAPGPGAAIEASLHAWHVHEWLWHEAHPGVNSRGNKDFTEFRNKLVSEHPKLSWVRDVAEAAKHRGLDRESVVVREVSLDTFHLVDDDGSRLVDSSGSALCSVGDLSIELNDGSRHLISEVLEDVFAILVSVRDHIVV